MQVPLESEVKKMQFQFKIPKGPASLHCKKKPINSSCGFLFKARSENHRSVDHRSELGAFHKLRLQLGWVGSQYGNTGCGVFKRGVQY